MKIGQPAHSETVYNWFNIIQHYVLPPTCILCDNPGFGDFDLCEYCYERLPRNTGYCLQCAAPMEVAGNKASICGQCLSMQPAFDKTIAPFIHQAEISYLISSLKYRADYKNARLLGMLLAEAIKQTQYPLPDCIIPVPLHKARYQERCFNQSIEIAKTVAKALQIPLNLNACIRNRDTPHQTHLSAKKRLKNVKNAFTVVNTIPYQHVAIVDDVMTTGSTVHNLAAVLKKAGVKHVDVWACARA